VAVMVLLAFTWLVLVNINLERAARSTMWILVLAGGTMLFQLFARRTGETVLFLGPLAITDDGINGGFRFGARIVLIAFSSLAFVWTTDPRAMALTMTYFRVPYRFAYMLVVALRILPVLENEATVIREAQAVRGVAEVQGRVERLQRYALPLLVAGIRKSEAMAVAMDCRGFGCYPKRTFVDAFAWSTSGLLFMTAWLILAVGLLVANTIPM
ncbi:MAG TPA: energy-coupling factor transporter transmembrane component T, partial [Chloroflexota bacterium]